jgi:hypothetical protein
MCKLLASMRLPTLVCMTIGAVVISASGDDKPQPKPAKVLPYPVRFVGGDQLILNELEEPTEMDFIETPLKDVIAAISTRHKNIPIVLDLVAITNAKCSADTPIIFQLRGFSLRESLRRLLKDHDLDFVLSHDALLITSVEKPTILRKFEVADLPSKGTSVEKLGKAVRFALPRVSEDNPVPDGEVVPLESVLLVRSNERGHANVETFLAELRHDRSKHDAARKSSAAQ